MSENLYASVANLKTRLGISDSSQDTLLGALLEEASRYIDELTNRKFYQTSETRYFDGHTGNVLITDDLVSVSLLTTDSEGDNTHDGETWTEGTDFVLWPINGTPKTGIYVLGTGNYSLAEVERYVKITGVWGWSSVPKTIERACLAIATRFYRQAGAEVFESESVEGYRYKRFTSETERETDRRLVNQYRRSPV